IVNGALGGAAPCLFGAGIIGEDPDDIEVGRIDEIKRHRILDAPSENEVQQLAHGFSWGMVMAHAFTSLFPRTQAVVLPFVRDASLAAVKALPMILPICSFAASRWGRSASISALPVSRAAAA